MLPIIFLIIAVLLVVGFLAAQPWITERRRVRLRSGSAVVSFHFGLPSKELLTRVRACGAKILSSATTVEEARWLEAQGVDAIIAQGLEAGGHRGMFLSDDVSAQLSTFALVSQVVQAVKIPVIAGWYCKLQRCYRCPFFPSRKSC